MRLPLNHLVFSNFKLRIVAGGGGVLAVVAFFVALTAVGQEKTGDLLAEAKTTTGATAGGVVGIGVASSVSSPATNKEKSMREILDTPLDGKLSLAVINRIEELPREKMDVASGNFGGEEEEVQEVASEADVISPAALAKRQAEHWKPMLVVLIAHHEDLSIPAAEAKLEGILGMSEELGNAATIQAGIETEDHDAPAMEARLHATEALLVTYVNKVMSSRRSAEWWQEWRDAWNRGVTRVPEELVGQWSVKENTGINFAQAIIADHRCTVIYQERAGGKVQKIDFDVMKATEESLSPSESDPGLRYRIDTSDQHEPVLIFDVPGRRADSVVKLQLRPDW